MDKKNKPLRILLVEDNKFDREIFKRTFNAAEVACEITECVRAEEALGLVRADASKFDVAVIDNTLPGMTGLDLCKTIHRENLELPLVLLTGTGSEEVAVEALETGVDDYIIKGSNAHRDILPLTIRRVVGKHVEKLDREKVKQELVEANKALIEAQDSTQNTMEALRAEIEERKKVEAQLRKLTVAVEQNPATIVVTDLEGKIEYVNPQFTESTGYTAKEAIGQNPRILKSGDQSDEFYRELWETITAGKTWRGDFHNKKKNGELYWESASISPIKAENGDVINFVAIKTDVTVRRAQEEALKTSEKKYRDTINTTREGYWLLDREGKILDVNESLCMMLGYLPEELLGKELGDSLDEENAKIFREQTSKIPLTSHRVYEITLKRKDGENVPAIVHATTIRDSSGGASGAFAFVTDISDLKRTEASLRLAKDEAEGATKLKDKFVSLVSHDLKNPIHRIMIYFEMLQSREQVSDSGKEMIEEGLEACDEMTVLINDVLSLSRIKGSSIKPEYGFANAHNIVDQAINNYHRIAVDKGIELISEIPGKAKIYADERLLLEVLRNLISNAVKFCKKGDRVRLYIPDGEPATIAVADSGTGIKDADMSTLFRYEEKTSTRGTSGEMGTGFGLPLCHEIVAAHGGKLEVESEVDKGSTFYVKLPDIKPTVLIVDDDESIRKLFRKRLEKLDIVIMEADSGETAIELIKINLPQLFFVDLHMPGMGGLELLRQIKGTSETEKIPVIVVTADKTLEVVDQAFMEGADDFIVKPFEKGELIESVERFVR